MFSLLVEQQLYNLYLQDYDFENEMILIEEVFKRD